MTLLKREFIHFMISWFFTISCAKVCQPASLLMSTTQLMFTFAGKIFIKSQLVPITVEHKHHDLTDLLKHFSEHHLPPVT